MSHVYRDAPISVRVLSKNSAPPVPLCPAATPVSRSEHLEERDRDVTARCRAPHVSATQHSVETARPAWDDARLHAPIRGSNEIVAVRKVDY